MVERKARRAPETTEPDPLPNDGGGFEAAVQRLAEIVEVLEGGELPLEESLKLFEEGVRLSRTSQKILDQAEQRVEELLAVDQDGNPTVREIDP